MPDLSKTVAPKSDQLNADDLIASPMILKITGVRGIGADNDAQPIAIDYEGGQGRPWKPCKSMRRALIMLWGADGSAYAGRAVQVYCDPNVKFGGIAVGGIRISHASHIDDKVSMMLTASKAKKAPFVVHPLKIEEQQQGPTAEEAYADAKQAAKGGSDAFKAWWNTDHGKSCRHHLKDKMDKLKEKAAKADAKSAETEGGAGDYNGN